MHNDLFNLPAGPPELCFDKNEFVKTTFSVDEFLHKNRNAALEALRDDLGIYLKVLRSAMIELINEDYADFVNLSSNLVGLNQSIDGIQVPLGQLKEEIIVVKMTLADTMNELQQSLLEKKILRNYLKSVQSIGKVRKLIGNLENLLINQISSTNLNPTLLERAAFCYIQLVYDLQFCDKLIEANFGSNKAKELHDKLLSWLELHFLQCLDESNDQLERCLHIYATLSDYEAVESTYRQKIVAKRMQSIISEKSLQNTPRGLAGIYEQILSFVTNDLERLISLNRSNRVKGFDFFVNSFWCEIEQRLENHMSSIFAPGNPDSFYRKYNETIDFLEQLEKIIGDPKAIAKFRMHGQYKQFQLRWNLPVYFQIRFQEIGGKLETSCSSSATKALVKPQNNFRLLPFVTSLQCIQTCWSDGIYVKQIFIRFYKLTLQILSRLSVWVDECIAIKEFDQETNKIEFYVFLHSDIVQLAKYLVDHSKIIVQLAPVEVAEHANALRQNFLNSCDLLSEKRGKIANRIVQEILSKSVSCIKQVNDIPRLYRKTNRDVPSKPCGYVDQMLDPSRRFREQYGNEIGVETCQEICRNLFSSLNIQYYSAVFDVLTSVQKTEESLRRLKNLREKSTTNASANDRQGLTDDDKIRLQLQVDIIHWSTEIEKVGVAISDVEKLDHLKALVEESAKIKIVK
ncbi:Conserved oligomeric Golgi complex subunit 2 [Pseudolycoriella hygida]|uniref:Conserved oligomeric Golgi complex subunit 2 n=1 Tax=Pseudolycoriella hygida TaxID=35572 RepID=A0A9Q0MS26_9DIPT|nr:Conserved oligomeric Golgi complex subunit 2 [Pseudolycoriella hygida]